MDAHGSGAASDIIQGIQVAVQAAARSGRPSVVNMSIGGAGSRALDSAATSAVNSGLFVVVAAGNDAVDAGTESPARAPAVITVGAANIRDRVSTFSNFGYVLRVASFEQMICSLIMFLFVQRKRRHLRSRRGHHLMRYRG